MNHTEINKMTKAELIARIYEIERENANCYKEMNDLKEQLGRASDINSKHEKAMVKQAEKINDLFKQLGDKESKIRTLKDQVAKAAMSYEDDNNSMHKICEEQRNKMKLIQKSAKNWKDKYLKLKDRVNGIYGTCVMVDDYKNMVKELSDMKKQLELAQAERTVANERIERLREDKDRAGAIARANIDQAYKEKESLKDLLAESYDKIVALQSQVDDVNKLKKEVDDYMAVIDSLLRTCHKYDDDYISYSQFSARFKATEDDYKRIISEEIVVNDSGVIRLSSWNKVDSQTTDILEDHYYYLFVIDDFGTPVKGKVHLDGAPYIEITTKDIHGNPTLKFIYFYENKIHYWQELPEMPGEENPKTKSGRCPCGVNGKFNNKKYDNHVVNNCDVNDFINGDFDNVAAAWKQVRDEILEAFDHQTNNIDDEFKDDSDRDHVSRLTGYMDRISDFLDKWRTLKRGDKFVNNVNYRAIIEHISDEIDSYHNNLDDWSYYDITDDEPEAETYCQKAIESLKIMRDTVRLVVEKYARAAAWKKYVPCDITTEPEKMVVYGNLLVVTKKFIDQMLSAMKKQNNDVKEYFDRYPYEVKEDK